MLNRYLPIFLLCLSCASPEKYSPGTSSLEFASSVRLVRSGAITYLSVMPKPGDTTALEFALVPAHQAVPEGFQGTVIRTPVRRLVCTSTTHIPLLESLNATHLLVGFPSTNYISSAAMRLRIDSGKVAEVGTEAGLNTEAIFAVTPDVVMASTSSLQQKDFEQLKRIGIPVLPNADYNEQHPLGRAEWIKVMAALIGAEERGDSVFQSIRDKYEAIRRRIPQTQRPVVLSGSLFGNAWYAPGGKSYMARLISDAGGEYVLASDSATQSLALHPEKAFEIGHQATCWIGCGTARNLRELAATDARYQAFKAFSTKKVYNYTGRIGPTGGVEFFESANLRPDIVLQDLAAILHPEAFPDYTLYYYINLSD